jgi:hypothetical protein
MRVIIAVSNVFLLNRTPSLGRLYLEASSAQSRSLFLHPIHQRLGMQSLVPSTSKAFSNFRAGPTGCASSRRCLRLRVATDAKIHVEQHTNAVLCKLFKAHDASVTALAVLQDDGESA